MLSVRPFFCVGGGVNIDANISDNDLYLNLKLPFVHNKDGNSDEISDQCFRCNKLLQN